MKNIEEIQEPEADLDDAGLDDADLDAEVGEDFEGDFEDGEFGVEGPDEEDLADDEEDGQPLDEGSLSKSSSVETGGADDIAEAGGPYDGTEADAERGDDVEVSLDRILSKRLDSGDDEEEGGSGFFQEDRDSDTMEHALPRQPDEFVCRSCFLVKNVAQLADRKRRLCKDCI